MNLNSKLSKVKVYCQKIQKLGYWSSSSEAGYHRQYNCDLYFIIDYDTQQPFTMCLLTSTVKYNNYFFLIFIKPIRHFQMLNIYLNTDAL